MWQWKSLSKLFDIEDARQRLRESEKQYFVGGGAVTLDLLRTKMIAQFLGGFKAVVAISVDGFKLQRNGNGDMNHCIKLLTRCYPSMMFEPFLVRWKGNFKDIFFHGREVG
jgi:hypothetical protein